MGVTNDAARIYNELTGENLHIAGQRARRESICDSTNMADHNRSRKKFGNGVTLESVTGVSLRAFTANASDTRRVTLRVTLNVLRLADSHGKYLQARGFNFGMSSLQLSDPMTADNSTKVTQEAKQSRFTRPHLVQMNRLTVTI